MFDLGLKYSISKSNKTLENYERQKLLSEGGPKG